ncbi:uncharacterized protein LOC121401193 [Xenopus laevis]|uniref:Uncharacterized protein LOC121401193 n=1 Tax=Xenopus laevis TaxID=8355 RepID=A0A8J1MIX6_XENLA|nr:uncharacterized protein LOC121401193 [Xenopus laevis]
MSIASFDELLSIVKPGLCRAQSLMRGSISPEERLCVTLRFLATGQSFASMYFQFLIGRSTISIIVRETCQIIWIELQRIVLPPPNENAWRTIAEDFYKHTNFPNCLGALDGKHIRVTMPFKSGSKYFNYKNTFQLSFWLVLMPIIASLSLMWDPMEALVMPVLSGIRHWDADYQKGHLVYLFLDHCLGPRHLPCLMFLWEMKPLVSQKI